MFAWTVIALIMAATNDVEFIVIIPNHYPFVDTFSAVPQSVSPRTLKLQS